MRFAYESYPVRGSGTKRYTMVHRPMIKILVGGPSGVEELMGQADIGADDTLLPDYLVTKLGVDMTRGERAVIVGIDGGSSLVRYGMVDLALPGYRWSARVGFHAGFHTILGHSGFLEYFTASFNGRRRSLTLTPNGTGPAPAVPTA